MNKKRSLIFAIVLIIVIVGLIAVTTAVNGKKTGQGTTSLQTGTNGKTSNNARIVSASDLFSNRDLEQKADTSNATKYEVSDDTDINITKEGVYVISGSAKNVTINVETTDEEKVQLVLDGLTISNDNKEVIHVESADKVFVTLESENSLKYSSDDSENATGAILSRSDLVFNGNGTLNIESTNNGIVGKDDIKITGGTYNITSTKNSIRANDSICINGGTFTLKAGTDGLHAENNDDDSKGYIYINSATLNIEAGDDAVHGISFIQVDGGTMNIKAAEGFEATYIQINDGTINLDASDDGINAAKKSSTYTPKVEINGGNIKINMGQGDTDGIDSNGDIIINGGTIDVTGNSTFDYDGKAEHNGGTIIINGEETDTIPNQFMGGGMSGGRGGRNRENGEEGFTPPEGMPEDFNPDDMPEGFTPGEMPGGFSPREMPSGEKMPSRGEGKQFERPSGDGFSRKGGNLSERKPKKDSTTASTEASI